MCKRAPFTLNCWLCLFRSPLKPLIPGKCFPRFSHDTFKFSNFPPLPMQLGQPFLGNHCKAGRGP